MPAKTYTRSFTPTLLVIGGVALLLGMLAVVTWTMLDSRDAARRQAVDAQSNLTLGLERDIRRTIDTLDLSLRAAATGMAIPGIEAMDPVIRQAILFDGAIKAEGVSGAAVTNAAGDIIYNSHDRTSKTINVADRDYFKAQRDRPDLGLTIAPPLLSRATGDWSVALTRRLNHPDGSFAGVVIGALQLSYLQTLAQPLQLGRLGSFSLFSTGGVLVAHTPYVNGDIGHVVLDPSLLNILGHVNPGIIERAASLDGVARLYSYRQVGNFPLMVSIGRAEQEIYADWASKTAALAGVLLFLLLLGGGLIVKLRQELLRRGQAEQAAKRSEQNHAEALARLNALFQHSRDGMVVARVNPDGSFTFDAVNPIWERLIGVSASRALGHSPRACLPPGLADKVVTVWRECIATRKPVTLAHSTMRDGVCYQWEVLVAPIFNEQGNINRLIAVSRDATQRKAAENKLQALNQELATLASTDGLTGLANRRCLDEGIEQEWRRAARDGSPLSILLIDLDRFKAFNDQYGHQAGDACLRATADAIRQYAGRPGDIAARYGGEEMAVLLPRTTTSQAALLGERVRLAIEQIAIEHGGNVPFGVVTGSIGVATVQPFATADRGASDRLVALADTALYQAKRNGRNQVVGPALLPA